MPASVRRCSVHEHLSSPIAGPQAGIAHHAALQAARKLQRTETFQQREALRAGGESTISQGVRAFDLHRSRSVGRTKTHVQHLAIATAIHLVRLVDWLDGNLLAPTRVSAFERLSKAASRVCRQCPNRGRLISLMVGSDAGCLNAKYLSFKPSDAGNDTLP